MLADRIRHAWAVLTGRAHVIEHSLTADYAQLIGNIKMALKDDLTDLLAKIDQKVTVLGDAAVSAQSAADTATGNVAALQTQLSDANSRAVDLQGQINAASAVIADEVAKLAAPTA